MERDLGAVRLQQTGQLGQRHSAKHDLETGSDFVGVVGEETALRQVSAHRVQHDDSAGHTAKANQALWFKGIREGLIVRQRIGALKKALALDAIERDESGRQWLWIEPRLQFPPDKADEPKRESDRENGDDGERLFRGHGRMVTRGAAFWVMGWLILEEMFSMTDTPHTARPPCLAVEEVR